MSNHLFYVVVRIIRRQVAYIESHKSLQL